MNTTPAETGEPVAFGDLLRDPRTRKPVVEVFIGVALFVLALYTLPDAATWFVHATPDQRLVFLLAVGITIVWGMLLGIVVRALRVLARHTRR